ncbi:MAG: hypothetical protein E6F95_12820 [Actinobacteria bacterium]|nr:MAG: hypothetical protein E6F95_12820 [Actinomycetota bacterium]
MKRHDSSHSCSSRARHRGGTVMRRLVPLVLLLPVLFTIRPVTVAAATRPNVVIIMTDDQRWDTVTSQYMPQLSLILANNPSVTYPNAFVPNTLCCPSRTSTLTGDYSHTTGVFGNVGRWGGFLSFTPSPNGNSISTVNDRTTMAVDMHAAGYRTALIGKYLNGYNTTTSTYVPPGWNRWFSVGTGAYYNYRATSRVPGSPIRHLSFGSAPNDYATRVLASRAIGWVQNGNPAPFFLYYAVTAPHGPNIPDPRDVGRFSTAGYVHPPSFGKVEDGAPNYIAQLPWSASSAAFNDHSHAQQLDTTFGVDRSIGQLWSALPDNTIVLFMSDNGLSWGEHRWSGKMVPYNEAIRIPLAIAGKNLASPLPTNGTDPRIVLNVDVLPTLEGYAGVTSGHAVEGLDMLGTSARSDFVLEHWFETLVPPTYCGVRSLDWMYVRYNRYEEPVKEGLYDEVADPFEMNNLSVTDPSNPELQVMRDRAATLCQADGNIIYPNDWPYS